MGKHRCICQSQFCREDGGDATIRMPKDADPARVWCNVLFGQDSLPSPKKDPRLSAAHFPSGSLIADVTCSSVSGDTVGVTVRSGALPDQTSDQMFQASRGALARERKLVARCDRHEQALVTGAQEREGLRSSSRNLQMKIALLEAQLKEATDELKRRGGSVQRARGIDVNILRGKSETQVRSITGLSSYESLQAFYEFLDEEGAAENMVFYDERDGAGMTSTGERKEHRRKTFRGVNGLFFTLMVLRTAIPLVVASTLFGVHETTGGRAFTTWLSFLYGRLRPFVRLPSLDDVRKFAPPRFSSFGYGNCAIVLDATELEICRSWQTDMNYWSYSNYKGRHTAKVLVGVTPAGAICYIGPAYPGRLSDAEVVRMSGLVDAMREAGLSHKGLSLMADKGFNAISPQLLQAGIHYVAPPYKRRHETQFTEADMQQNWEVANLRIHVERAIGAMKNWNIINVKYNHKQLDHLEMSFRVVAALVNMIHQPFASDK